MKATLSLEYIGESQDARLALYSRIIGDALGRGIASAIGGGRMRQPWVAEILGPCPKYKMARQFLRANWQRKRANGSHSRGVELWFVLESGRLYQVKAPVSWRNSEQYFCRVTDSGEIVRVQQSEVEQWLSARSVLTS